MHVPRSISKQRPARSSAGRVPEARTLSHRRQASPTRFPLGPWARLGKKPIHTVPQLLWRHSVQSSRSPHACMVGARKRSQVPFQVGVGLEHSSFWRPLVLSARIAHPLESSPAQPLCQTWRSRRPELRRAGRHPLYNHLGSQASDRSRHWSGGDAGGSAANGCRGPAGGDSWDCDLSTR